MRPVRETRGLASTIDGAMVERRALVWRIVATGGGGWRSRWFGSGGLVEEDRRRAEMLFSKKITFAASVTVPFGRPIR